MTTSEMNWTVGQKVVVLDTDTGEVYDIGNIWLISKRVFYLDYGAYCRDGFNLKDGSYSPTRKAIPYTDDYTTEEVRINTLKRVAKSNFRKLTTDQLELIAAIVDEVQG